MNCRRNVEVFILKFVSNSKATSHELLVCMREMEVTHRKPPGGNGCTQLKTSVSEVTHLLISPYLKNERAFGGPLASGKLVLFIHM